MKLKHLIIGGAMVASLFALPASASILQGFQGGTGFGPSTTASTGNCLILASTTPWITYSFGSCGSSGSSTTGVATGTFGYAAYFNGANTLTSSTLYGSSTFGINTTSISTFDLNVQSPATNTAFENVGTGIIANNTTSDPNGFTLNTVQNESAFYIAGQRILSVGGFNTFVGVGAGGTTTPYSYGGQGLPAGNDNTAVGFGALGYGINNNSSTGSYSNVALGYLAGLHTQGTATATADNNVFLGNKSCILNVDGHGNSCLGAETGYSNPHGNRNTWVGWAAGGNWTAGSDNIAIGGVAGNSQSVGTNNILIGDGTDLPNTSNTSNTLDIANFIYATPLTDYGESDTSTVNSTAKFGIGTSTPATTLVVNGDITDVNTKSASVLGTDSTGKLIITTTTALGSNAFTSTVIPTTYVSTLNGASGTYNLYIAGTGLSLATGTASTTITWTNPGYISGNQSITFTGSGDVTGTTSGATSLTPSLTVQGLQGKSLAALATGTLYYTGGAMHWGNAVDASGNQYVTSTTAGAGTISTSTALTSGQIDFSSGPSTIANISTFTFASSTGLFTAPTGTFTGSLAVGTTTQSGVLNIGTNSTTTTAMNIDGAGNVTFGQATPVIESGISSTVSFVNVASNTRDMWTVFDNLASGNGSYFVNRANSNYVNFRLQGGSGNGGLNSQWDLGEFGSTAFSIYDDYNGLTPFTIAFDAPTNALTVGAAGNVDIQSFLGVGGEFYSQRTTNNITNTTTASLSLINTSTYAGTTTIPANFLQPGDTIKLNLGGSFTANTGNYTWKVWINSATTTCTTAAYTPTAHTTGFQWNIQGQVTVYTTGTAGTWGSQCALATNSAAVTNQYVDMGNTTGAINTTIANTIGVALTMATASTTNSVTTTIAEFNILRAK